MSIIPLTIYSSLLYAGTRLAPQIRHIFRKNNLIIMHIQSLIFIFILTPESSQSLLLALNLGMGGHYCDT